MNVYPFIVDYSELPLWIRAGSKNAITHMAIFTNISKRVADLTSKVRFLEIVALSSHVQSTVPR
jgi:hypothetical protein